METVEVRGSGRTVVYGKGSHCAQRAMRVVESVLCAPSYNCVECSIARGGAGIAVKVRGERKSRSRQQLYASVL